ncbi:MAG: ESPR-type extended signal peptide-containing protein, partial [Moraxella sp.]|uniref:ESPR-type extended signal peptide-containing protein n=1 Tax=Moraxella sp. TaxID=479 RepID=UPI0026DBE67F
MNHIYKVVFCKATNTFVAVTEYARAHGKSSSGSVGSSSVAGKFAKLFALTAVAASVGVANAAVTDTTSTNGNIHIQAGSSVTDTSTGHRNISIGSTAAGLAYADSIMIGTNGANTGDREFSGARQDLSTGGGASVGIGNGAQIGGGAQDAFSVGVGYKTFTAGPSVAFGAYTTADPGSASGPQNMHLGKMAIGTAARTGINGNNTGIAIGTLAQALATDSMAVGARAYVSNNGSGAGGAQAIGHQASALGQNALAVGREATTGRGTASANAISVGYQTHAVGNSTIAVGNNAQAGGYLASEQTAVNARVEAAQADYNTKKDARDAKQAEYIAAWNAKTSNPRVVSELRDQMAEADIAFRDAEDELRRAKADQARLLTGEHISGVANAIAIGNNSKAHNVNSLAMGNTANAQGVSSTAIGNAAYAYQKDTIAIGTNAKAGSTTGTTIDETGSIAIGVDSAATLAVAHQDRKNPDHYLVNKVDGSGNFIKSGNTTALTQSVAVGKNAKARAGAVAIGSDADAGTIGLGVAVGALSTVSGIAGIAVGQAAYSSGNTSVTIGRQSTATGDYSQSYGNVARASGAAAIAMGHSATATGERAIAIGNPSAWGGSTTSNVSGGTSAQVATNYVADVQTEASGQDAIAFGTGSKAKGTQSIAFGYGNIVTGDYSGAFGDPTTISGSRSYSLGNNNTISGDKTFVVGNNVTATAENNVILGNDSAETSATTAAGELKTVDTATVEGITYSGFAGATPVGIVSVGAEGAERRLINVAAGEISDTSTDAINGSQLYLMVEDFTKWSQGNTDSLGGGASYDPVTNTYTAPTYNIYKGSSDPATSGNGNTQVTGAPANNVGDAISALNSYINEGFKVLDNGGATRGVVTPGESIQFVNGTNTTANVTTEKDGVTKISFNATIPTTTLDQNIDTLIFSVPDGQGNSYVDASSLATALNNTGFLLGGSSIGGTFTSVATDKKIVNGDTFHLKADTGIKINQIDNGYEIGVDIPDPETEEVVTVSNGTVLPVNNETGLVTAGNLADNLRKTGFKVSANNNSTAIGGTDQLVNTGETLNFNNGTGTTVEVSGANVKVNVNTATAPTTNPDGTIAKPANGDNSYLTANDVVDAINSASFNVIGAGNNAGGDFASTPVKAGGTITYEAGDNLTIVQQGAQFTFATAKDVVFDSVKAGPVTINQDGIDAGNTKITNVAAGEEPNDAVNVSQLNAAKTSVEEGDGISVTTSTNDDGSTVYNVAAKVDGDTIKIDENGNIAANTTPLTNNATNGTVEAPANPNALATAGDIADAINNSGFLVTSGKTDGENSGSEEKLVKTGEMVTFNAGENLEIVQDGATFEFKTKKDVKFDSVQYGDNGPIISNDGNGNLKVGDTNGEPVKITNV